MIRKIMSGSLIRDTPTWARMSAGTRSRAITATAPASSAILAWSGVTTSMITPPLSISAIPRLTRAVPVRLVAESGRAFSDTVVPLLGDGQFCAGQSRSKRRQALPGYSHSMVPGGLLVMSSTTRLTSRTSLVIRVLIFSSTSYGSRPQSAVIASSLVTGRSTTGCP